MKKVQFLKTKIDELRFIATTINTRLSSFEEEYRKVICEAAVDAFQYSDYLAPNGKLYSFNADGFVWKFPSEGEFKTLSEDDIVSLYEEEMSFELFVDTKGFTDYDSLD